MTTNRTCNKSHRSRRKITHLPWRQSAIPGDEDTLGSDCSSIKIRINAAHRGEENNQYSKQVSHIRFLASGESGLCSHAMAEEDKCQPWRREKSSSESS